MALCSIYSVDSVHSSYVPGPVYKYSNDEVSYGSGLRGREETRKVGLLQDRIVDSVYLIGSLRCILHITHNDVVATRCHNQPELLSGVLLFCGHTGDIHSVKVQRV